MRSLASRLTIDANGRGARIAVGGLALVRCGTKESTGSRPIGAIFAIDLDGDRAAGNIVRLTAFEAEIQSPWPPPVDHRIVVWAELISGEGEVAIPGRVDWSTGPRFGVVLGPLGPRETYAILRAAHRFETEHRPEKRRDERSRAWQQPARS